VRRFLFQTIHDVALMLDRERVGREASPTGGVIDSQSVKAPEAKTRGYDAGKKIVGRKRHIAVDTDGRLLMVNLTTADISDSAGAQMILDSPGADEPAPIMMSHQGKKRDSRVCAENSNSDSARRNRHRPSR
jgi:hypothetical protein